MKTKGLFVLIGIMFFALIGYGAPTPAQEPAI